MLFAASVLLLLCAGLAAIRLPALRADLTTARAGLSAAQEALRDGDASSARGSVAAADRAARSAQAITRGPAWRLVRKVPGLGTPFRELTVVSEVALLTTSQVAQPLAALEPPAEVWKGRLDTAPLVAARVPLARAEGDVRQGLARLDRSPDARVGPLSDARQQLTQSLLRLQGTIREARVAADVLPVLAGNDRPRRYLIAIQNPAEPRATGGLLGAYGVLRAERGRLTLEDVGSNNELKDPAKPVVDLGAEFDRRYSRFGATAGWRSANLSPDVPSVGRILSALWQQRTGQRVDGVIFLDPTTLSRVLRATGPVRLADGTNLTAANAVSLLESVVYRRFPRSADAQRNDYLQQAARLVFQRLTRPGLDGRRLLEQGSKAVGTGHLRMWSAEPAIQARLRTSSIGGALPGTSPFLQVVAQDAGGSKLGYYLRQDVSYDARRTGEAVDVGAGPRDEEEGTVSVVLRNTAPRSGLPEYVTLRADAPDGRPRPVGQIKLWVSVYLGPRATLLGATLDGRPIAMSSDTERGHAVFSTFVSVDPGARSRLVLKVRQQLPR